MKYLIFMETSLAGDREIRQIRKNSIIVCNDCL